MKKRKIILKRVSEAMVIVVVFLKLYRSLTFHCALLDGWNIEWEFSKLIKAVEGR